jgi:hypothetical protein
MRVMNPFIYGEIVPPEAFLDRETERDRLAHDLLDGQKVFLLAPRRYGKSSLLGVVLHDLRGLGAQTVALTVAQHATYRSLLEGLAEACLRAADLGTRIREFARGVFTLRPQLGYAADATGSGALTLRFEPGTAVRDDDRLAREVFALPGLLAVRTGRPWVVALDEFQAITSFDGRPVEDALRAAVQSQRRVGYVFAGSGPSLMAQMLRPRRPFYKAGPVLTLEKIPAAVFVTAIVERFARSGLAMADDMAADLVERALDVPYDVQRLAHELWDDAVHAGVEHLERPMLDATIRRLLGAQRPLLDAAWQRLTLARRAVLRAVAGEDGQGLLSAAVRTRYGLGPKSSVQRALAILMAEEWITRDGDRHVFVDSLQREYVRRETR